MPRSATGFVAPRAPNWGIPLSSISTSSASVPAFPTGKDLNALLDAVSGVYDAATGSIARSVPGSVAASYPLIREIGPDRAATLAVFILGLVAIVMFFAMSRPASPRKRRRF